MHYEKLPDGTVKCIEDEIPFELPEGWEWTRLGSLCFGIVAGKSIQCIERTPNNEELGIVKVSSVSWGIFQENESKTCIGDSCYKKDYIIRENDFLISRSNTTELVGSCVIVETINKKLMLSDKILRILFSKNVLNMYILIAMRSSICRNQIESKATCTSASMKNISQDAIKNILIPLPSSQEQYRIAAKYNELLNLIDTIESDKTDLRYIIQLTKSKILDLAIRGQLVPQNPDDEPASVLLDRIRAAKQELIKQGKIKRDKKESVIFRGDDNSYYLKMGNVTETIDDWGLDDIPDNWGVCCLGEVCDYGNCINVDTKDIPETAWILDLEDIEKDTGKVLQKLTLKERNSASTKHLFHKGQVLYSKLRPYLNKVVLADDDGFCTSEILPLDFDSYILPEYAKWYMMSPTFLRYANHCSYGVKMPRLGTLDGKKAVLTVPPINEQKRIADKVSQLFSLLDSIAENVN